MLNAGSILSIAVLSLLAVVGGTNALAPEAPKAMRETTAVAPIAPRLISFTAQADAPKDTLDQDIAKAIREIESSKDLDEATKKLVIENLRHVQHSMKSGDKMAPHVFRFESGKGDAKAPKAERDVRIVMRDKDGKVHELRNPSEKELKAFHEKMGKDFGNLKFKFDFDGKDFMKFHEGFKFDGKMFEDLHKHMDQLKKERGVAPRASDPATARQQIQREIEAIRKTRAELDARERKLMDELDKMPTAKPTSAI